MWTDYACTVARTSSAPLAAQVLEIDDRKVAKRVRQGATKVGARQLKGRIMAVVTTRQLLENGVHFGHQTRRWNPKMKRFIFTERNGIYIIDLRQSLSYIDKAYEFVSGVVSRGGQVLFVGTKKQAQEPIAEQATRVGMPYVNQRWLGGMLTNFDTVSKRVNRLKELEAMDFEDTQSTGLTKKELLGLSREKDKLAKTLGGIRDMGRTPQAVWIVDTKKEHLAIDEARKLRIPVVAILDTNCDPDEVDWPIPGNDDSIRSVTLLTRIIADAVADGLVKRGQQASGNGQAADAQPMAEWERDLLGVQDAGEAPAPATPAGDLAEADSAVEASASEASLGESSHSTAQSVPATQPVVDEVAAVAKANSAVTPDPVDESSAKASASTAADTEGSAASSGVAPQTSGENATETAPAADTDSSAASSGASEEPATN